MKYQRSFHTATIYLHTGTMSTQIIFFHINMPVVGLQSSIYCEIELLDILNPGQL